MNPFRVLPAILAVVACQSAAAAVVYSENFNSLGGTGVQEMSFSWSGSYGDSSSINPTIHNSGLHRAGTVKGENTTSSILLTDYLFAQNSATATAPGFVDYFLRTTGVTAFAPNDYTALTATWNRNGNTVAGHNFTVLVGSTWYVAQTAHTYTTSGAGQGAAPALNLLTASWRSLSATSNLEVNADSFTYSDLFGAGQQISGVGFFIDDLAVSTSTGARTIRIDDIAINGVPEPSTALAALLGMAGFAFRRSRK